MPDVLNTQDKNPRNARVLVAGEIGVGKSTQIATLPGKKFVYVFDPNTIPSLEGHDIDYMPFIPDVSDVDLAIKTLKKGVGDKSREKVDPKTYLAWEEDFDKRYDSDFFLGYDWLGFDSLTTLSEIVMDRVQFLNGRLGKHPEQADYTAEMNAFRNIFRAVTSLDCNLYCTAHLEPHKDDTIGKTYFQLIMTGRNRTRIPMRFSQIYALEVDANKEKANYLCHTVPDRWFRNLRTNIRGLKPTEDVTIDWMENPVGQGLGRFVNN